MYNLPTTTTAAVGFLSERMFIFTMMEIISATDERFTVYLILKRKGEKKERPSPERQYVSLFIDVKLELISAVSLLTALVNSIT